MSLIKQSGEYQINWDLGKDVTYEILIATLGGYEAAKKIAENTPPEEIHQTEFFDEHGNYYANDCGDLVIWGGYGWLGVEGDCPTLHCIDYLIHILLQYRRQHNIYEVGDWAFTNNEDFSEEPCQLIEDMGYDFKYETKSGHWGFIVKSFLPKAWRHAKDEEIEANKRLEGNS